MDSSELRHNQRGLSNPFDLVGLFETNSQIRAHINHLVRFVPSSPIKDPMGEPGLCSRCKGVDVEDLPVACTVLKGGPCSACGEKANIRSQIKGLEEEIIKLKEKHHALRTTMNTIHDPFIHKLPPEIGSLIFYLCIPTSHLAVIQSKYTEEAVPQTLRLGAVCRKWRELAWATPNLWETLLIRVRPSTSHTLVRSLAGLISEWLDRSGVLPLTISFFQYSRSVFNNDTEKEKEEFGDAITRIIGVINLHSGRWRNLYLDSDADVDIIQRLSGSMHPTQLFRLELAAWLWRSPTQTFMMKSKPFPKHLTLCNFSPTSIDIGWDNITHATLSNLSANECVEVLRRAPAVEHLNASAFRESHPPVNDNALTVHPRIRSLDLSDETAKFLNMITIPALEEWTHFPEDGLPVDAMVSLITRSGCCLKVLNLENISAHLQNLPTLFSAMPSLERLQIDFKSTRNVNDVMNAILARIFRPPPYNNSVIPVDTRYNMLLPRLQFMKCKTQFSWDRVPQLYRLGHRHSLTLKSPTNRSETSDETAMELLNLVDEGAKFLIFDKDEGGDFLANLRKRITDREACSLS
jgi:hypothetical protein